MYSKFIWDADKASIQPTQLGDVVTYSGDPRGPLHLSQVTQKRLITLADMLNDCLQHSTIQRLGTST